MSTFSQARAPWRFIYLGLLASLAFFLGCDSPAVEPPTTTAAVEAEKLDMDPALTELLELKTEHDTLAFFMNRLEGFAKQHGWQPQLGESGRFPFFQFEEARCVLIRSGQVTYVVVLLKSSTHSIPGTDAQTAILLDNQGTFLDRLTCEINSRLTHMCPGQLHVVIPKKPEPDGAQLVIRLDGVSLRENFSHDIDHGGKRASYYWGHDRLPQGQPTKWDALGLCRIRVTNGKFSVLFPSEIDADKKRVP